MRPKRLIAALMAVVCLAHGCKRSTSSAGAPSSMPSIATSKPAATPGVLRKLHYVGYHDGSPVIEAQLEFAVASDGKVTGNWNFGRVVPASTQGSKLSVLALGPQIGQGELNGEVAAGLLSIRTTNAADYEVILASRNFSGETIVGTWAYRTDAGVETEGTFRAQKR